MVRGKLCDIGGVWRLSAVGRDEAVRAHRRALPAALPAQRRVRQPALVAAMAGAAAGVGLPCERGEGGDGSARDRAAPPAARQRGGPHRAALPALPPCGKQPPRGSSLEPRPASADW